MASFSAKVNKAVVYDSRMLQNAPRYAIERGALSVNPQIFSALTATASAHTFTILPPYQDVFWDRYLLWENTTGLKVDCTFLNDTAMPIPAGTQRLFEPGTLWALAPFPNTQLVTSLQMTFNNGTLTTQLNDTLDTQLRMCALWANNSLRVAPHKLDRYARVSESIQCLSSVVGGYELTVDSSTVPNGCGARYWFTTSAGGLAYNGLTEGNVTYDDESGQPHNANPILVNTPYHYTVYLKVRSVEPIWLSPLIFSDVMEDGTAITGVKQASLTINVRTPGAARYLRYRGTGSMIRITSLDFAPSFAQTDSKLQAIFLSAPLSLPKAPASVIPYIDVPRFPFAGTGPIPQMTADQFKNLSFRPESVLHTISSNVIVFQQIPDLIAVMVRPANGNYAFGAPTPVDPYEQGTWVFPIYGVSITFNNRSGLMASATQEQLFHLTRRNGLRDLDWSMFSGYTISAGDRVQTVGSAIVLRPTDWGLDDALAPGINGAWSFQITVQFYCTSYILPLAGGNPPAIPPEVLIMPYNSGFFVTREGESERVMGVLTPAEVVGSATAPYIDRSELARVVGAGMLSLTQHAPGHMRGWTAPRGPAAAPTAAMYGSGAPASSAAAARYSAVPSGLMADRLRGPGAS